PTWTARPSWRLGVMGHLLDTRRGAHPERGRAAKALDLLGTDASPVLSCEKRGPTPQRIPKTEGVIWQRAGRQGPGAGPAPLTITCFRAWVLPSASPTLCAIGPPRPCCPGRRGVAPAAPGPRSGAAWPVSRGVAGPGPSPTVS